MKKFEALKSIFEVEGIESKLLAYSQTISYDALLRTMSKHKYSLLELGASSTTITRTIKVLWPDKPSVGGSKICNWLFAKYSLKLCPNCEEVKELFEFSKNSARSTGLNSHCRACELITRKDYQREYRAGMRAKKLDRTPSWSQTEEIKDFYSKCPEGFHVDHIVPLQGTLVSGLHVIENLQYLPAKENLAKQNKFEIE